MRIKGELTKRWNTHGIMYAIPENNKAEVETNWGEDELMGALASGYCDKKNSGKVVDATLIVGMLKELLKLFNNEANKPSNRFKESEKRVDWKKMHTQSVTIPNEMFEEKPNTNEILKSTNLVDDYMDISELDERARKFMERTCKECRYRKESKEQKETLKEEKSCENCGRLDCESRFLPDNEEDLKVTGYWDCWKPKESHKEIDWKGLKNMFYDGMRRTAFAELVDIVKDMKTNQERQEKRIRNLEDIKENK